MTNQRFALIMWAQQHAEAWRARTMGSLAGRAKGIIAHDRILNQEFKNL